jgi:uncharacterized protein (TIGR03083 family)
MHSDPDPLDTELDYVTHLAYDSARFVDAIRTAPSGTRVPTCPDWDADDLLWHLAEVQWFWGSIVGRGLTTDAEVETLVRGQRPTSRDGLLAHFSAASADLQQNLRAGSPHTRAWTWSDDQTVGFILRRQAHEAMIHRIDAELTAGERTAMDAELSADGVDEVLRFLDVAAPSGCESTPDPTQTVLFRTTDHVRSWLVTLGQLTGIEDDGTPRDDPDLSVRALSGGPRTSEPAASVSGTAADLDCWLWHRPPVGQITRTGDPLVLERFDQTMATALS